MADTVEQMQCDMRQLTRVVSFWAKRCWVRVLRVTVRGKTLAQLPCVPARWVAAAALPQLDCQLDSVVLLDMPCLQQRERAAPPAESASGASLAQVGKCGASWSGKPHAELMGCQTTSHTPGVTPSSCHRQLPAPNLRDAFQIPPEVLQHEQLSLPPTVPFEMAAGEMHETAGAGTGPHDAAGEQVGGMTGRSWYLRVGQQWLGTNGWRAGQGGCLTSADCTAVAAVLLLLVRCAFT